MMKNKKVERKDENWLFEKHLAVFLGEFDAAVQIADEEDRFLTDEEIKKQGMKLRGIWEEHIRNMGKQEHLEQFKECYNCQNRKTPTDPLMTIGVIRCQNTECNRKNFSEMFNAVYTKRDIDRAREHMEEMTRTPDEFEPDMENMENISGETMMRNTKIRQKQIEKDMEKEKEAKEVMYT